MVKPQELNYDLTEAPTPKIKMMQVLQNEGGQAVQIQVGGGTMSTFYITFPAIYFNKSYLSWRITPPAAGNANFNWMSGEGCPQIRQLRVYFKSTGTELVNIQNFHKYMNLVSRRKTSLKDLHTRDKLTNYGTDAVSGQLEVLSEVNALPSHPIGSIKRFNNSVIKTLGEALYVIPGAANTATPVIDFLLRLDAIEDLIGDLDKLFYSGGQDIVVEVYWGGWNQSMWVSNSATDPAGGDPATATSPTTVGAANSISNLRLMVATETDSEILQWAAHKFTTEGFTYKYRDITGTKGPSTQGTQQNIDVRMTYGAGKRLAKVHWGCYNIAENANTIYDHNNINGAKVQSYQTYLNDQLLVNGRYEIGTGLAYTTCDDYNKERERLKGSAILSRDEYYFNWCATVDFTLERARGDDYEEVGVVPLENIQEGIALGPYETKVSFVAQTANLAFNHYIFYITERELTLTPGNVVRL